MHPSPANLVRYTLFAFLIAFPSLSHGQGVEEEVIGVEVVDGDQGLSEEEIAWRNAYEPLREAIEAGDLAETRRLLRRGPSPDVVNQLLEWTLKHALRAEEQEDPVETVEALLAAGADPNVALPRAAYAGFLDTVRVLLEAGADPNSNEELPALYAIFAGAESGEGRSGHTEEVVSLLLEAGVDLTARDGSGQTVPMLAASAGDEALLDAALDAGADLNAAIDQRGQVITALDMARAAGHHQVEQRLLEAGAMEGREVKALLDALDGPNPEEGLALLRAGADPAASFKGITMLMVAAYQGHVDVVAAVLEADVDVNVQASERQDYQTALDFARQKGHSEVERLLLDAGAVSSADLQPEGHDQHDLAEEEVCVDGCLEDIEDPTLRHGCNFDVHTETMRELGMDPERVAIFPWVHLVTVEQAATASIEPDRVTFPKQSNPWLDIVQKSDVLWAPVGPHEQTFILRVIDREDREEHVTFRTRVAAINEVICHAE